MSQTLHYKGYDGSVAYSADDKRLRGRVLGTRDMISYGGTGVNTVEANFRSAVDEYFAFCKAEGMVPNVPLKGSFKVRLPRELYKRAALYADEHDRKLIVQAALQEYLTHAD